MITERLLQARYDNLKKTHWFYTFGTKLIIIALIIYSEFVKKETVWDVCLFLYALNLIYCLFYHLIFVLKKEKYTTNVIVAYRLNFPRLRKFLWILNYIACIVFCLWFNYYSIYILCYSTFYCSGVYETFEYIELKMHFAAKEENRRRYDYTVV